MGRTVRLARELLGRASEAASNVAGSEDDDQVEEIAKELVACRIPWFLPMVAEVLGSKTWLTSSLRENGPGLFKEAVGGVLGTLPDLIEWYITLPRPQIPQDPVQKVRQDVKKGRIGDDDVWSGIPAFPVVPHREEERIAFISIICSAAENIRDQGDELANRIKARLDPDSVSAKALERRIELATSFLAIAGSRVLILEWLLQAGAEDLLREAVGEDEADQHILRWNSSAYPGPLRAELFEDPNAEREIGEAIKQGIADDGTSGSNASPEESNRHYQELDTTELDGGERLNTETDDQMLVVDVPAPPFNAEAAARAAEAVVVQDDFDVDFGSEDPYVDPAETLARLDAALARAAERERELRSARADAEDAANAAWERQQTEDDLDWERWQDWLALEAERNAELGGVVRAQDTGARLDHRPSRGKLRIPGL